MILEGVLALSTLIQAIAAVGAIALACRYSNRLPFLPTLAVIFVAILLRRLTALAVTSTMVKDQAWAIRAHDDIQTINNVVIPLFVGIATLVLVYELHAFCSPRKEFARGVPANGR